MQRDAVASRRVIWVLREGSKRRTRVKISGNSPAAAKPVFLRHKKNVSRLKIVYAKHIEGNARSLFCRVESKPRFREKLTAP